MLERSTGRRAVWTTVQFVSNPPRGSELVCRAEVVADGKRTAQARVTARAQDEEVFTALGAAGSPRGGADEVFVRMPTVAPPGECPPAVFEGVGDVERSYFAAVDRRVAVAPERVGQDVGTAGLWRGTGCDAAFWVRIEGQRATSPLLGYFGDVAALGLYGALGLPVLRPVVRAASVDNTLRVGGTTETEWVLLDVRAQAVASGYGQSTVHLWSPAGRFLGQVSQTLALRDPEGHLGLRNPDAAALGS
jgi:acyl-CoA thioesterase